MVADFDFSRVIHGLKRSIKMNTYIEWADQWATVGVLAGKGRQVPEVSMYCYLMYQGAGRLSEEAPPPAGQRKGPPGASLRLQVLKPPRTYSSSFLRERFHLPSFCAGNPPGELCFRLLAEAGIKAQAGVSENRPPEGLLGEKGKGQEMQMEKRQWALNFTAAPLPTWALRTTQMPSLCRAGLRPRILRLQPSPWNLCCKDDSQGNHALGLFTPIVQIGKLRLKG